MELNGPSNKRKNKKRTNLVENVQISAPKKSIFTQK